MICLYLYRFADEISLELAVLFIIVSLKIYLPLEEVGSYQEILTLIQASLERVNNVFSKEPLLENKKLRK